MSADNWSICPKCKVEKETLAEYYEFYIKDGYIVASFACNCNNCGFSQDFEHKEKLNIGEINDAGNTQIQAH